MDEPVIVSFALDVSFTPPKLIDGVLEPRNWLWQGMSEGRRAVGNRQVDEGGAELDRASTDLDTLGIQVSEPVGEVEAIGSWLVIGTLVATGSLVEAIPRCDLVEAQMARLLAAAARVWLHGRACLRGWKFRPGLGWSVDVSMRQPSDERRLANSSRCFSDGVRPRVLAGFSRPSGR